MFPIIVPCAVIGQVADSVGGQGLAVVAGQQVLPRTVPVAVGDGVLHRAQRAGGVGVLLSTLASSMLRTSQC